MQSKHNQNEAVLFLYLYILHLVILTHLILHLLAKGKDLVSSSTKCTLNFLSKKQLQIFSNSLPSCFAISSKSVCWYMGHESSAYKNRFDFTARDMSLT